MKRLFRIFSYLLIIFFIGIDVGYAQVSVVEYGANGGDADDDTDAFNKATKQKDNPNITVPAGTYIISGSIDLNTNQKIKLDSKAILKFRCAKPATALFNIKNKSNVSITGGSIDGEYRDNQTGSLAGIRITGSSDTITISNILIKNMPTDSQAHVNIGDGIYIGNASNNIFPTNVTISGVTLQDNQRNNISITGGSIVTIKDSTINGAANDGVDLETNYTNYDAHDITIQHSKFSQNHIAIGITKYVRAVTIKGNTIDVASSARTYEGVHMGTCKDIVVDTNTITGGYKGIVSFPSCPHIDILNNTVSKSKIGIEAQ